jgi:hypothetical protein
MRQRGSVSAVPDQSLQVDLLSTLRVTKVVVQSGSEWQYNDEFATVSVCKTAACLPSEVPT